MILAYKNILILSLVILLLAMTFPAIDFIPHINDFQTQSAALLEFFTSGLLLAFGLFIGICLTRHEQEEKALHVKESAIASSINAIAFSDLKGYVSYVNPSFLKMWGYEDESEIIGQHISNFYPYEERYKAKNIMNILKQQQGWTGEIIALKKDRSRFFSQISAHVVCDARNHPLCMMSSTINITEKKMAEKKLVNLEKQLLDEKHKLEKVLSLDQEMSSILQLNHLVDFIVDKSCEILESEKCSLMLLDEDAGELIIRGARGLRNKIIRETRLKIGMSLSGQVVRDSKSLLVKDIDEEYPDYFNKRSRYKTKSFMIVPLIVHNKLIGVVNVSDINHSSKKSFNEIDLKILNMIVRQASIAIENAEYYRKLEYLSSADSITGIYNHRFFIKALDKEIQRICRYPKSLSLLMIDVNDFKSFNVLFGHLEGDALLKNVSHVISDELRSIDIVCRYAGDQFVVILPETDDQNASIVAKKILKSVEKMKSKASVSVSIGISTYAKGRDRRDLIVKADRALSQAKKKKTHQISLIS